MQEGDRLAHYEILGLLGKGGMGEVHRARDTVLDREAALKVLPDELAADPERLARFQREARLLAALNHPNIATIYGLAEAQERMFLAMELAEGETLAERIDRGAMPPGEAVDVALQIASGLEAAHEKGIVHRDLKPANVKLGPDGAVKILDFGLARAYQDDAVAGDLENSPTLTAAMTRAGVILGTAAYMSPEQARGAAIDARSDIWSFGVILWELLAGRRLFAGETISDTLAMVLRGDPDWEALPAGVSQRLRRLLRRCLQRDRRQRLHHIADARILLQEIKQDPGADAESGTHAGPAGRRPAARAASLGWPAAAVVAVVAAVLGWQALDRQPPPQSRPGRFDLTLPADTWLAGHRQSLAVSPSGDAIVVSLVTAGDRQLFLRTLDDPAFVPIAGTERATTPFFSPDGRWLAFTQDGWLRKIPREGGSPMDLSRSEWGGGDWASDGRIIFTRSYASGLDVVSAAGGQARRLTETEPAQGELGHWWPQLLPGEDWVIYTSWSTPIDRARVVALSLATGERRVLVEGGAFGRWSPTGHLLFVRGGRLLAAPFDLKRMVVVGNAEPVLDDIYLNNHDGYANLSFGRDGTLVYAPASVMETPRHLVWVDRVGTVTPLDAPARRYDPPRLSPDGSRLAVSIREAQQQDLWLHDLGRGTWSRFTFSPSSDFNPLWTPDGRTVIYNGEEPQFTIYRRPADGSAETELLLRKPGDTIPTDLSPDGRLLVYGYGDTETDTDIYVLPLDGDGQPRVFLRTRFSESKGTVSPDGRWLAYVSNESGRNEVYAMAFPDGGARVQISIDGGDEPAWSPRGDEIFFRHQSGLWTAAIDRDRSDAGQLVVGRPRLLFSGHFDTGWSRAAYQPTADGQRFLMIQVPEESMPRTLRVIVNWFTELERLAPPRR